MLCYEKKAKGIHLVPVVAKIKLNYYGTNEEASPKLRMKNKLVSSTNSSEIKNKFDYVVREKISIAPRKKIIDYITHLDYWGTQYVRNVSSKSSI